MTSFCSMGKERRCYLVEGVAKAGPVLPTPCPEPLKKKEKKGTGRYHY